MPTLYKARHSAADSFDPFTDLLFNTLLGFVFMFVVAYLLINPQAKSGAVETKAEFIVTATWPDNHPDDVDLYLQDPADNVVWYHSKEAGLIHLDRDDRGNYRDTIVINGEQIQNPLNQETATVRGIVPGEYVVNIYHFVATSTDPVPVSVKVEKINPRVQVVSYDTVELDHRGQEETIVRFTVGDDGEVTRIGHEPKSLTRSVRKPSAGNSL